MILGYHHVAFKAANKRQLEEAVHFYTELFDFEIWGRYGTEDNPKVFLTDGRGGIELSIFSGWSPVEGTIRHIAIGTDDNAADIAHLREAGVEIIEDVTPVKHLWPGHSVVMSVVRGVLGETIELVQEVDD